jgi:hypothetical protein
MFSRIQVCETVTKLLIYYILTLILRGLREGHEFYILGDQMLFDIIQSVIRIRLSSVFESLLFQFATGAASRIRGLGATKFRPGSKSGFYIGL